MDLRMKKAGKVKISNFKFEKFNGKSNAMNMLNKKLDMLNKHKIKPDTHSNINTPRRAPGRKSLINELVEWSVGQTENSQSTTN